ncbi:hypothetical protein [Xanthovirga aplysinae]|uniref:hypothetical protein n=1 Tax=Xanthovirga aplysinae TaxID=2529853 RepID=UPI0012BB77D3|nr:hypothetical protein [Xanthovirga aplysinae]MTI29775.1 hypothetical protein [Xanthovirga aplysinae]
MSNTQQQKPGFNCPECGSFIQTNIELILSGKIYCSSCGLELTPQLDQQDKEALKKMDDANQKLRDIKRDQN